MQVGLYRRYRLGSDGRNIFCAHRRPHTVLDAGYFYACLDNCVVRLYVDYDREFCKNGLSDRDAI